jgi:lipopolysaccharide/colanic/teichoic acid biosynthesis glycosyltransferase
MSPFRKRFSYGSRKHSLWQGHTGYYWTSQVFNHIFNVALASVLLLLMVPAMLVLAIIIFISDGRPIFYAGARLTRDKRPFTMYKFRTLKRGAEDVIGAAILEVNHEQGTLHGHFLRDTRLDELPQLYNVIRRDMDLVGPRPIRPLLYEKICKDIAGYDRRFAVNAGLIGYAQLFTPHSTPKRIRVLIDNALVKQKLKPFYSMGVVAFTGYVVIKTTIVRGIRSIRRSLFERYAEKRHYERKCIGRTDVMTTDDGASLGDVKTIGWIQDINDEAFLMMCREPLPEPLPENFKLTRVLKLHGREKRKTTRCKGTLYRKWETDDGTHAYVFAYNADSPLMAYQFQQYFLQSSFA